MVMSYGLSFSAAKAIVGRVVVNADKEKRSVHDIDTDYVDRAAMEVLNIKVGMTEEDIKNALDPVENVMRRTLPGGPSPDCVQAMIDSGWEYLEKKEKEWRGKREFLACSKKKLFELADQMIREAD